MKKLLKVLVWIAGSLVALVILAVIGIKLFLPVEKIKTMAAEKGSAMSGREITIRDLDISIWGGLGIELQGVTIGNPPGLEGPEFLSAEYLDLKLQFWPLLTGEARVDRLIIKSPTINMWKRADGSLNYAFALTDTTLPPETVAMAEEMAPEAQPAAAAVSFEDLEIQHGRLQFQDDSSGVSLSLVNLDLTTAMENPTAGRYVSSGRLKLDSVSVTLDEAYPSYAIDLNYRVQYEFASGNTVIERADLKVNNLDVKITGELTDLFGNLAVKANVKSDYATVADLLSLLPAAYLESMAGYTVSGDFALDVDLDYHTPAAAAYKDSLLYSGTATLSNAKMASTDIDGELVFARCVIAFKPDNVRAAIEDGSFDGQPLKGHVVVTNFENPYVSGELAGSFDLAFVEPFLPPEDGHKLSGRSTFDFKFDGLIADARNMNFAGNIKVDGGAYNSALVPEPISQLTLDAYVDKGLLNIRTLSGTFPSGRMTFKGRVADIVPYFLADSAQAAQMHPEVEGTLAGTASLTMANPYLPEKGHPSLSGTLDLDLGVTGRLGDMASFRPRGRLAIKDASYTDSLLPEPVTQLAAQMQLTPDTITIGQLDIKFVSSDVSFKGQLVRPFPYLLPIVELDRSALQKPFFSFELSAKRFDTDKMFPEAVPGSGADPTTMTMDSVSIFILPDIDGRGTLKADTVIYCAVEFTSVDGKVKIYDRKIECYDATANVYTGRAKGSTTIDLNNFENPHYSGEFEATQIEADDFVRRFSKFGGYLFGKANFTGSYDAYGWDPDAFLNSLSMNGKGEMREGKLVTSGAIHGLLSQAAQLTGETFDKEQAIKAFATNIVVQDGKVKTDKLTTSLGSIGQIAVDGFYGFDGTLDYNGTIIFSKEKTTKFLSQNKLLGDLSSGLVKNGQLELGWFYREKDGQTNYGLDQAAIEKAIKDAAGDQVKDAAQDLLKGLFGGKKKK